MAKLIDLLLDKKDSFVQKRRIKKGFEMQLKKLEAEKDSAEARIDELRTRLVKADSAEKVAEILNDMCGHLQSVSDCDNTKLVLEEEKKTLFEVEVK